MQRVLHLVYPQTQRWGFFLDDNKDMDDPIFRSFLWSLPQPIDPPEPAVDQHSVVVAFQAPWVLSPQDLQRFADCRSVCDFSQMHVLCALICHTSSPLFAFTEVSE